MESPTIHKFINHLRKQGIEPKPGNIAKLRGDVIMPEDLINFYSYVDGMCYLYPNNFDTNGFLIYPIEALYKIEDCLQYDDEKHVISQIKTIVVFGDHMQESWWYVYWQNGPNNYNIGIMAYENKVKRITSSIYEFLEMIMNNSNELYDY